MSTSTARAATIVLHVGRQYRGSEKLVVESALRCLPGVLAVGANPAAQTATVTFDRDRSSVAGLRRAALAAGFECAGCSMPGCQCDPLHEPGAPGAHDAAVVRRAEDADGHGHGGHAGMSMEYMASEMRSRFLAALAFTVPIVLWSGIGNSLFGHYLATPFA